MLMAWAGQNALQGRTPPYHPQAGPVGRTPEKHPAWGRESPGDVAKSSSCGREHYGSLRGDTRAGPGQTGGCGSWEASEKAKRGGATSDRPVSHGI